MGPGNPSGETVTATVNSGREMVLQHRLESWFLQHSPLCARGQQGTSSLTPCLLPKSVLQGSRGDPGDLGPRGDAGPPGPKVKFMNKPLHLKRQVCVPIYLFIYFLKRQFSQQKLVCLKNRIRPGPAYGAEM